MDIDFELHPDESRDFFIVHLNKIYAAKSHLVSSLGTLKTEAHFSDLKKGVQATANDVKKQLERLQEIYALLETEASEERCNGFSVW